MVERKGTIIFKLGTVPGGLQDKDLDSDELTAAKLLAVEVELNGTIASELYRKHGVAIRVHVL